MKVSFKFQKKEMLIDAYKSKIGVLEFWSSGVEYINIK
jgi:hypothetical protein